MVWIKNVCIKLFNNIAFRICSLFIIIFATYYVCNVTNDVNIKYLGWIYFIILGATLIYFLLNKQIDNKKIITYLFLFGIGLRIIYAGYNDALNRQHDVLNAYNNGHYGYALYIFRNNSLPNTNVDQFYQPPLNAILQALWMRFNTLFIKPSPEIADAYLAIFNTGLKFSYNNELIAYLNSLYNTTRILSCFYSCLTLIVIYYILKEFNLKKYVSNLIFAFMCFQPVLTMMAGTSNNDNLSYLFFFLALLFAIKWFKNPSFISIILMALSIGLGMITKLSIGFIALLIGPMMIYKFIEAIKNKQYKLMMIQFVVFAIIVFPLGLSYAIRNLVLFKQSFTYILSFGEDSWLRDVIKTKNFYQRFLSFPLSQFVTQRGIFHDYQEYNIWVDLLKTSTYEEFGYVNTSHIFAGIMLISNALIYISGIASIIYIVIMLFKRKYKENIFLTIISLSLTILALGSYISLNIKMPFSCTSNFRYISYLAFSGISLIVLALQHLNIKKITQIFSILIGIFGLFTTIFIMLI